jgi:hypothetical protein
VIVNLTNGGFSPVEIVAQPAVKTKTLDPDPFVSLGLDRLHPPAALSTVRPDGLEVQRGRDNLDIRQGELRSLGDNLSVESNQRRPIVIEPVAIASLLIGVKVDTSELWDASAAHVWYGGVVYWETHFEGSLLDQLDSSVKLSQLVMTGTGVGKDLDSIETHQRMGPSCRNSSADISYIGRSALWQWLTTQV